jgi:hypothetical protein
MNGVRSIRAGPLRDTDRDQWTFDSCLDWPTGDGLLLRVFSDWGCWGQAPFSLSPAEIVD